MKKTDSVDSDAIIYQFCGDGQGIPGLPHEISQAEADELGVGDVLKSAIEAGVYQPKEQ
jgi:hypothetical protein